jgi:heme/copper-type cytochrome/quinol oxidase subunit 2
MIQIKHIVKYALDIIPIVLSFYLHHVLRFELHKLAKVHNIPTFRKLSTVTIVFLIMSCIIFVSNWTLTIMELTNNNHQKSMLKNYRIIEMLLIITRFLISIAMLIMSMIAFVKLDDSVVDDKDVKTLIAFCVITPISGIVLDVTDFLI